MSKPKGRPSNANKNPVNKYKSSFIAYMHNKHGSEVELHYEDSNIIEYPHNERYTEEFLKDSIKKVEISFGNNTVKKYKQTFLDFLKTTYGNEKYLEYVENKNIESINKVFPGEARYSEEYCNHRTKNTSNVKRFRRKAADAETRNFNEILSNLTDLLEKGKKELIKNKSDVHFICQIIRSLNRYVKCAYCGRPAKQTGIKNHLKNCQLNNQHDARIDQDKLCYPVIKDIMNSFLYEFSNTEMASSGFKDNFEEISKFLRCKKSEIFRLNKDNLIQNDNENENEYYSEDSNDDLTMANNESDLAHNSNNVKNLIRTIKNLAENLSISKPDNENLNGIEEIYTFLKNNYKIFNFIQACDSGKENNLEVSKVSNNFKSIVLYRSKSCSFHNEIPKSSVNILLL